jgi:hypothetical protein
MHSGMVISRAHHDGTACYYDHILDTRSVLFASFITDLVLLSLMLFGVLRWKQDNLTGGIWHLMYTQVGPSHLTVTVLTMPLDRGHRD